METARYVCQLVLALALPLVVQRWDRKRLSPDQEARAWNCASWASALYGFNILSMIGWFWVTRKSAKGLVYGVASTFVLLLVLSVLDYFVARALGLAEAPPWQVFV